MEIRDNRDNLFHICQFAEMMEQNGNTVEPLGLTFGEQAPAPQIHTMDQTM